MKKIILIIGLIIATGAGVVFFTLNKPGGKDSAQIVTTEASKPTESQTELDKTEYSLTDPTSIWVVVNKKRAIPIDFKPELQTPDVKLRLASSEQQMQINKTTAGAIKELFDAAKLDDINLVFGSGYRSGNLQQQFYNSYKNRDGQAAADTYSARPGHSEHQTGFSADITSPSGECHLEICWADTPEGKWLASNADKYGFIIRYPKDQDSITGYQYEPWHIRFVGKKLAQEIKKSNQTLEEFFDLGAAPNYD